MTTPKSSRASLGDHLAGISEENQEKFEHAVFILYNDIMRKLVARAEVGATSAVVKVDPEILGPDMGLFNAIDMVRILVYLLNAEGIRASISRDSPKLIVARWPDKPDLYRRDN